MIEKSDTTKIVGARVLDEEHDKVGTVGDVYVNRVTERPLWVSVRTGLFGRSESFIPLDNATWDGEYLHVPFDKKMIKNAPRVEVDVPEIITSTEERTLYDYYDLDYAAQAVPPGTEIGAVRLQKFVSTTEPKKTESGGRDTD